jgi:hypothetical protein
MASFTTLPNGQHIATDGPALHTGFKQTNVLGGPINAASAKTVASLAQHAEAAKAMGAGQKGSSRRRRHRKYKGGSAQNLNANVPEIPSAGSIPGVNHVDTHIKAVDNLNNVRYAGTYDKLINAPPIKLTAGTRKRKNKSKKRKNGRRSKRTHRRNRH